MPVLALDGEETDRFSPNADAALRRLGLVMRDERAGVAWSDMRTDFDSKCTMHQTCLSTDGLRDVLRGTTSHQRVARMQVVQEQCCRPV